MLTVVDVKLKSLSLNIVPFTIWNWFGQGCTYSAQNQCSTVACVRYSFACVWARLQTCYQTKVLFIDMLFLQINVT